MESGAPLGSLSNKAIRLFWPNNLQRPSPKIKVAVKQSQLSKGFFKYVAL